MAIGLIVQRSLQQLSGFNGLAFCLLWRHTAAAVPGGNAAIELIQPSR